MTRRDNSGVPPRTQLGAGAKLSNVRSMSSHSLCEPLSGLDDRFRSTRQVGSQAAALTQPKASSKGGSAPRGGVHVARAGRTTFRRNGNMYRSCGRIFIARRI
jgi:hypothetical protein